MGIEQKTTRTFALTSQKAFATSDELAKAWLEAVDDVLKAAADTSEFHTDRALGRSRTASIRRLKAAIDHLDKLERMIE